MPDSNPDTTSTPPATPPVVAAPPAPVVPPKPAPAAVTATPTPEPAPTPAPAEVLTAAAIAANQQARLVQQQVSIITEQLEEFATRSKAPNPNAASFQACAKLLTAVIISITNRPIPAAMTVVWDFFVANKTAPSILDETRALQGIEVVNKNQRATVELVYTLFRKAVTGINVADPKKVAQLPLQQTVKCPALITFLSAQAKVVVGQAAAAAKK